MATIVQGQPMINMETIDMPMSDKLNTAMYVCLTKGEQWQADDILNNVGFQCVEVPNEKSL